MKRSREFYYNIFSSWTDLLKPVINTKEFNEVLDNLGELYRKGSPIIYPKQKDVFKAFKVTPLDKLCIVFLRHQPYDKDYATGLAIASDNDSFPLHQDTFRFIKVIEETYYDNLLLNPDFSLEHWAKQGILFLNTALTTSNKGCHIDIWADFTIGLLEQLAIHKKNIIYCFLDPQSTIFREYIDETNNKVVVTEPIDPSNHNWTFPLKQMDDYITIKHNRKINW